MLNREFGFALNNGHRRPSLSGPKSAMTGLMHRSIDDRKPVRGGEIH
jgi:hypothetical protein